MLNIKKGLIFFSLIFLRPILNSKLFFIFFSKRSLFAFVFHDTSDRPSKFSELNDLNVFSDVFKKQIKLIAQHFNVISVDELFEIVENKKKLTEPTVLITFDDGYKSLFNWTFNYLEKERIPAMLFVNGEIFENSLITSGVVDYLVRFDPEFKSFCLNKYKEFHSTIFTRILPSHLEEYFSMSLKQDDLKKEIKIYCDEKIDISDLKKFESSKFITYGSHMYNHFNATILSEKELQNDFQLNNKFLSIFKNFRPVYSAPFGICTEALSSFALSNGFKIVFAKNNGINSYPLKKELLRITLSSEVKTEREFIVEVNKRIIRSWFP